jgi:hypothetical protein
MLTPPCKQPLLRNGGVGALFVGGDAFSPTYIGSNAM